MAGLSELFGRDGAVQQLMLWGMVGEVLRAEFGPFFLALQQDASAAHPVAALPADLAAQAVARRLISSEDGKVEAARAGLDAGRWATLERLAAVRLSPADLADAALRSYVTVADAEAQAAPQGYTGEMMKVLTGLAGDAPGPQQLAEGLRRGLIKRQGRGLEVVSYEQGIAESRLHDKWADLLLELTRALLSPPDAASAVVRHFLPHAGGAAVAAAQGVDAATFTTMVELAGDAPGPQQLAEALRRGLIPAAGTGPASTSFAQGIAEGRLADKWAPVIEGLARLWPTPTDALDAAVKGQLTPDQGKQVYELLGGDPQFYTWLLGTIGGSPSPLEAAMMAARGVIPWDGLGPEKTSYAQAVKESRYKDKWSPVYRALAEHIPPPSTVVTLLAHRQIDHDVAAELLAENDVRPDVAGMYLGEAAYTAISDYRGLTQSAVVDMYYAHLISRSQAVPILEALHVTQQAAELLLSYADLRQVIDSIQRSVQRIAGLFTGRKITAQTAQQALIRLGIPASSVADILATWELQAAAEVKVLTPTQIVDAFYYGIMSQDDAMTELQAVGMTAYDAWVLLSIKAKGPLPGAPARVVGAPPGAVIPGTT